MNQVVLKSPCSVDAADVFQAALDEDGLARGICEEGTVVLEVEEMLAPVARSFDRVWFSSLQEVEKKEEEDDDEVQVLVVEGVKEKSRKERKSVEASAEKKS